MSDHICPWWLGYLLLTPLRRLKENPAKILPPFVRQGMLVLEPGPAMGFFTLEMARLVGPAGRVVAIDLQEKMLSKLRKRAAAAGVGERIETRLCTPTDLGISDLEGRVDFVLLFHMLHEVAEPDGFLRAIHAALKPGGSVLFVEPRGHVSAVSFNTSVQRALAAGFEIAVPADPGRLRIVLRRPA